MSRILRFYTKKKDVVIFPDNFNEILEPSDFLLCTKKILFGNSFNSKINKNVIPNNVTEIIFGNKFNQELEPGVFPESVKVIIFGGTFNKDIKKDVLPSSLITLNLGFDFSSKIEIGSLPSKLENLVLHSKYNDDIIVGLLPDGLKKLVMYGENNIEVGALPNSIEYLMVETRDIVYTRDLLPLNLKYLHLPQFYDKLNECSFPPHLEIICISSINNKPLKADIFPDSVHTVVLGRGLDSIISILHSLPLTITTICFKKLTGYIDYIPISVTTIKINKKNEAHFIRGVPFGCKIVTQSGKSIEDIWFDM